VLNGEAADGYTLIYARIAQYLDPQNVDAVAARRVAARRPRAVRSGDRSLCRRAGRPRALPRRGDGARRPPCGARATPTPGIEVLRALAESHPGEVSVHVALGDALRRAERFGEATPAYDRAVALFEGEAEAQWLVYFSRAITHEREAAGPRPRPISARRWSCAPTSRRC
jgi:hypothetical protein